MNITDKIKLLKFQRDCLKDLEEKNISIIRCFGCEEAFFAPILDKIPQIVRCPFCSAEADIDMFDKLFV